MTTPLDRLDPVTLHGLMRAIMSANYEDAIDAKSHLVEGMGWSTDESRLKELEHAICSLCQYVEKSMSDGTLTPFKGDYVKWLEQVGFVSPRGTSNA